MFKVISIVILYVLVTFLFQLFLHELGHLLFGWLTGWKFIYLQIGHILFYKSGRHCRKKMVSCKGLQCILQPGTMENGSAAYTLGGLILNFIASVIGLILSIKEYSSKPFLFLFFICFTLSGISLLAANGIPAVRDICNDMACLRLIKHSKATGLCHNIQLIIAGELMQGRTYAGMCKDLFYQGKNIEINDITAYSVILNYYYHIDRDEFKAAHNELAKIKCFDNISNNIIKIYNLECYYLHMIMSVYGCMPFTSLLLPHRDYEISFLKENTIKGDIHVLRVEMMHQAYVKINNNDLCGAIKAVENGVGKLNNTSCIYPGEKLFCIGQLQTVCNMLKRITGSTDCS